MKPSSTDQPWPIRLALIANVLFWDMRLSLFGAEFAPNLLVTIGVAAYLAPSKSRPTGRAFLCALAVAMYGTAAFLVGPCHDSGNRVLASAMLLIALGWSLGRISSRVNRSIPLLSPRDAWMLLFTLALGACVEYVVKVSTGMEPEELRAGGFYAEPSHLALSAVPLIAYLWHLPRKNVIGLAAISIALVLVSSSSTLLILLALGAVLPLAGRAIYTPLSGKTVAASIALVAIALLLTEELTGPTGSEFPLLQETFQRARDVLNVERESNLSSLVYVNGWQLLGTYLVQSNGLGLGFNAMGCNPQAYTEITGWLEALGLADQNYNDGSFLLAKLGSELGIAGVLLFTAMTIVSLRFLFRTQRPNFPPNLILPTFWLYVLTVGGLVRSGGGYFTGPTILGLLSILALIPVQRALRRPAAKTPADPGLNDPISERN